MGPKVKVESPNREEIVQAIQQLQENGSIDKYVGVQKKVMYPHQGMGVMYGGAPSQGQTFNAVNLMARK